MLRLFWADVSSLDFNYEKLPLSHYRRKKLEKIKIASRIQQSIGAELLLIQAIKSVMPDAEVPLEVCVGEHQKPYLKDIPIHFNLSHSGDYAVCAIADVEIGVDVECKSTFNPRIAERFFCVEEQQLLNMADDKNDMFCRLWTSKESALKLLGTGLNRSLASLNVLNDREVLVRDKGIVLHINRVQTDGVSLCACTYQAEDMEVFEIEL